MRTLASLFVFVLVAGTSTLARADIPPDDLPSDTTTTGTDTGGTDTGTTGSETTGSNTGGDTSTGSTTSDTSNDSSGMPEPSGKKCSVDDHNGLVDLAALALLLSGVALRRRRAA